MTRPRRHGKSSINVLCQDLFHERCSWKRETVTIELRSSVKSTVGIKSQCIHVSSHHLRMHFKSRHQVHSSPRARARYSYVGNLPKTRSMIRLSAQKRQKSHTTSTYSTHVHWSPRRTGTQHPRNRNQEQKRRGGFLFTQINTPRHPPTPDC